MANFATLIAHPDTAKGVAGGKARQGAATDKLSFAEDQAKATGVDARTVRRDATRGERIAPEVIQAVKESRDLNKGVVLNEIAKTPREQHTAKLSETAAVGGDPYNRPLALYLWNAPTIFQTPIPSHVISRKTFPRLNRVNLKIIMIQGECPVLP